MSDKGSCDPIRFRYVAFTGEHSRALLNSNRRDCNNHLFSTVQLTSLADTTQLIPLKLDECLVPRHVSKMGTEYSSTPEKKPDPLQNIAEPIPSLLHACVSCVTLNRESSDPAPPVLEHLVAKLDGIASKFTALDSSECDVLNKLVSTQFDPGETDTEYSRKWL